VDFLVGVVKMSFRIDNLGVYCFSNNNHTLISVDASDKVIRTIRNALETEIIRITIAGTTLVGTMVAGNNNGLLVPYTIEDHELALLREFFPKVEVLPTKMTALGNIILANDYGALVHPKLGSKSIEIAEKTLGVKITKMPIAGVPTVGIMGVVNNKGMLVHPNTSDDEIKLLREIFSVSVERGTVNRGNGYVKLGIVANSRGAVVGSSTTGFELAVIERALGFSEGD
jgi:translation initiation factor 6